MQAPRPRMSCCRQSRKTFLTYIKRVFLIYAADFCHHRTIIMAIEASNLTFIVLDYLLIRVIDPSLSIGLPGTHDLQSWTGRLWTPTFANGTFWGARPGAYFKMWESSPGILCLSLHSMRCEPHEIAKAIGPAVEGFKQARCLHLAHFHRIMPARVAWKMIQISKTRIAVSRTHGGYCKLSKTLLRCFS